MMRQEAGMATRQTILIVDDTPENIEVMARALGDDYRIRFATSGVAALNLVQEEQPALILLDLMMPGMDGYEVLERLKEDGLTRDIPVIFVTARNDMESETHALEAGGVDFITKPVNPAVVRARIKTHLTLQAQKDFLRSLAFIDGLTGLANRRRFDEALDLEWRFCKRHAAPLVLLFLDVDFFKRYNDHYGHLAGDDCLKQVAAVLSQQFRRPHDLVARYGGEEFVCLLPESDLGAIKAKAQALCDAVAAQGIPHETSDAASVVTISIGMAVMVPNDGNEAGDLVAMADANLYAAKEGGRNRVCSS